MLRNVLMVSGSGAVLFHKAWYDDVIVAQKVLALSGAVTSIQEFARHVVGYLPSYVEFGATAMTLLRDDVSQLQCVLFHDSEDGQNFGRLVASQLLHSFLDEYGNVDFARGMHDNSQFAAFATKLHDAIRYSVIAVLSHLASQRGYLQAIVVYEDGKTHTNSGAGQEIELAANIQPLVTFSNLLIQEKGDKQNFLYMETTNKVVLIHRLSHGGNLVCVCKQAIGQKEANRAEYMHHCSEAVTLLEKVFQVVHNLHT